MIAIKNIISTFVSTNAVGHTTVFSEAETCATGDERRFENFVYKSTHENNTGNIPTETLNRDWVEWEPANDYAMIDYFRETATLFPDDEDGVVVFDRLGADAMLITDTNSEQIVVEYLDDLNNVIDPADTETYTRSVYMTKYDIWTYIFGKFIFDETQVLYTPIKMIGTRVRVTFKRDGFSNSVGTFFAGERIDFGATLDSVPLSNTKYGKKLARQASFTTTMDRDLLMYNLNQADVNSDEVMGFVIDPSENSRYNNLVIIGKLIDHSGTARNSSKNHIEFKVEQNIRR